MCQDNFAKAKVDKGFSRYLVGALMALLVNGLLSEKFPVDSYCHAILTALQSVYRSVALILARQNTDGGRASGRRVHLERLHIGEGELSVLEFDVLNMDFISGMREKKPSTRYLSQ